MPFKLTEQVADTLLDKLSSDDDFRELFQKDPRQALVKAGHTAAADASLTDGAWSCMAVDQLASKDAIKASRDAIRKNLLTSQAGQSPIHLNVAKS